MVDGAGPVEHGRDERGAPGRAPVAERLVRRRAGRTEFVERRAGHGTDRRQRRGKVGAAAQVDHDDRLAQPYRGVHELETAGRGAGPGRAGDEHATRHLGPGQCRGPAGKLVHPQAGATPGDDPARPHRTGYHGAPEGDDQAGARRADIPLVRVQPVQPGGERSFRRARHQRDRELPEQPVAHVRVGHAEVQQPGGVAEDPAQVRGHPHGARREPRDGRRGPDRQRPHQPGGGRGGQPGRAPPAHPGHADEDERQHQRQLGEDHMQDHQRDTDRSQELATAGRICGYHVACVPWRALRR